METNSQVHGARPCVPALAQAAGTLRRYLQELRRTQQRNSPRGPAEGLRDAQELINLLAELYPDADLQGHP